MSNRHSLAGVALLLVALLPALHAATDSALVSAAKDGDLRAVRALLAKRVNVNETARDGSTALLWAVYHSDVEMTKALLAAGAKADTANKYGVTPLIQAARTGDTPLIDSLLKAGAKATLAHPDGETALMAAARTGRIDAVRLLIEAASDVNATTYQQETPLMWASAEGHAAVVKALLDAKADANRKTRITTLDQRKHADHPTGGFTALMYAVRNGHEAVARALAAGGADLNLTNGDGATALIIAIVNDRLDLAGTLVDLGANANDGSLYFAVDMHDATTDMRARDGSRLRADHPNKMTALDLIARLLEKGADPNKAFTGQLHSSTLCCGEEINASPFYRAAVAADVEALKLMIKHGADVEWSPKPVKKPGNDEDGGGGRGNANVGRTPVLASINGGRGAAFAAGPGFERLGPPPFREASNREPVDAIKVLLAAGANPNVKAPDGSTPLHQAVTARQVPIIRELVGAGAKLDAVNKDNLTPLQLAEKPEPPPPPGNNTDSRAYRPKRNTREEVIAAVRELMKLGPNDPTPVPPPVADEKKAEEKKDGAK
ncbi:MAG TPA: ankyrin repeat domain-containing protein [Vicinamibacterales bacterium]|nr:ankyrin repeat domain-containing protein [Vicinamibacterales bacterium]